MNRTIKYVLSKYLLLWKIIVIFLCFTFYMNLKEPDNKLYEPDPVEKKTIRYNNVKNRIMKNKNFSIYGEYKPTTMESYPIENNPHYLKKIRGTNEKWIKITESYFIYSSYWDSRSEQSILPFVRTFGMWKYDKNKTVKIDIQLRESGDIIADKLKLDCFLWNKNSNTPVTGNLEASFFEESKTTTYVGFNLLCTPPTENKNDSFYAVSFLPKSKSSSYPHKLSYLKSLEDVGNPRKTTSVCVRPLFGPYHNTKRLLQFVMYYSEVLNIQKFNFYVLSVSYGVKELLQTLIEQGVPIEINDWNLPTGGVDDLWDYGSLVATNDCLYRSMPDHLYTIVVDLDEFIVSKHESTEVEDIYVDTLKQKRGKEGDAVLIPNALFCTEFREDSANLSNNFAESTENPGEPQIFESTIREARMWPSTIRSKMVLFSRSVVWVGHHMVNRFVATGYRNLGASSLRASLHHYRSCAGVRRGVHGTGALVLDQRRTVDKTMLRYRNGLKRSSFYRLFKKYHQATKE